MKRTMVRCLVAAFTAGALLGVGPSPSSAAAEELAAGTYYETPVWNANSGKAMAILNASKANGASAIQYDYTNNLVDNDVMRLEYEGTSNVVRIKPKHSYSPDGNVHNDMCLAVLNASFALYQPIVQATCTYDDIDNDVWYEEYQGGNGSYSYYQYRNFRSHLCLVVKNASTANYAQLIQYTCNGTSNSIWYY